MYRFVQTVICPVPVGQFSIPGYKFAPFWEKYLDISGTLVYNRCILDKIIVVSANFFLKSIAVQGNREFIWIFISIITRVLFIQGSLISKISTDHVIQLFIGKVSDMFFDKLFFYPSF